MHLQVQGLFNVLLPPCCHALGSLDLSMGLGFLDSLSLLSFLFFSFPSNTLTICLFVMFRIYLQLRHSLLLVEEYQLPVGGACVLLIFIHFHVLNETPQVFGSIWQMNSCAVRSAETALHSCSCAPDLRALKIYPSEVRNVIAPDACHICSETP